MSITYSVLIMLLSSHVLLAQFVEPFDDADLSTVPTWSGDLDKFLVDEEGRLQSNGLDQSDKIHLTTLSLVINDATWSIDILLNFAPSSSNRTRIYLTSDSDDLLADLNGYYIEIGQSSTDYINFVRQDQSTRTVLKSGNIALNSPVDAKLDISRDALGNWRIDAVIDNGDTETLQDTIEIFDDTHITSSFFGIVCQHTRTRAKSFFFDNIEVAGELPPLEIIGYEIMNERQLELQFNRKPEMEELFQNTNYYLSPNNESPLEIVVSPTQPNALLLNFEHAFTQKVDYQLSIEILNTMSKIISFEYDVEAPQILEAYALDSLTIRLIFDEEIEQNSAQELGNYSIDKDLEIVAVKLTEALANVIELTVDQSLAYGNAYQISMTDISDIRGNRVEETQVLPFTFEQTIDSIYADGSYVLIVKLRRIPLSTSAENPANYQLDDDQNPALVIVDNDEVTLIFEDAIPENELLNLSVLNIKKLDGNILANQSFSFVHDTEAPGLTNINVIDDKTLEVIFSEQIMTQTELAENHFALTSNPIKTATKLDGKKFRLEFENSFESEVEFSLEVENIEDKYGNNSEQSSRRFVYDQQAPRLDSVVVLSPHQVKLIFHEALHSTASADTLNYIIPDLALHPAETKQMLLDKSAVVLTFSNEVFGIEDRKLEITKIEDLSSNAISDTVSLEVKGDLFHLSHHNFVSKRELKLVFNKALNSDEWMEANYFSIDGNQKPMSISMNDERSITLRFASGIFENNRSYRLSIAELSSRNNQTLDPVSYDLGYQNYFDDYEIVDDKNIALTFDIDLSDEQEVANINLNDSIHPIAIRRTTNNKLHIVFREPISKGTTQYLKWTGIRNIDTNPIDNHQITMFRHEMYDYSPSYGDIVISEIMADPTPTVALPDAEYIELYNRTDQPISLSNITFQDENGTFELPEGTIFPQDYSVIWSEKVPQFDQKSDIHLPSLSLKNAGEKISILHDDDLIHSVNYQNSLHDDEKNNGGWSLEMMNEAKFCEGQYNYTSSTDASGGTPRKSNSVTIEAPDNLSPQIMDAYAINENQIVIDYNEAIHPMSVEHIKVKSVPEITVASAETVASDSRKIIVTLADSLNRNTLYALDAEAVYDCVGNIAAWSGNEMGIQVAEEAQVQDIIINEILFNPRPNSIDFVEIVNRSDKFIDLKNLSLSSSKETESIVVNITDDHLIMKPNEIKVLSKDNKILKANHLADDNDCYVDIENFPAFNDDMGEVRLLFDSLVIDQFAYQEDYHFSLLQDHEGVSLERISYKTGLNDRQLWKSAASTTHFASPCYPNSQSQENEQSANKDVLNIHPKILSPNNDGYQDYANISTDHSLTGMLGSLKIYGLNGQLIKVVTEQAILGNDANFVWDGTDQNGSLVAIGYYIIVLTALSDDGRTIHQKETVAVGATF